MSNHSIRRSCCVTLVAGCLALSTTALADDGASANDPSQDAGAKLAAGSVWKGNWLNDHRHAKAMGGEATLRVKTRDGKVFTAGLQLQIGKRGVQSLTADGRVTPQGVIQLKPTSIEGGNWPRGIVGSILSGHIDGDTLTLTIPHTFTGDANVQGVTITLTLSTGDDK